MNKDESAGQRPPLNNSRRLQIIKAGAASFGIYADEIATITPWQKPAPLPHAPASVLGVVSIQGRMLTVFDLEAVTSGVSPSDPNANNHSHIVALRGDEQLAIAIEAPGEIVEINDNDLLPGPASATPVILRVFRLDNAEIGVIDIKELFPTAIQGRERRRRRF